MDVPQIIFDSERLSSNRIADCDCACASVNDLYSLTNTLDAHFCNPSEIVFRAVDNLVVDSINESQYVVLSPYGAGNCVVLNKKGLSILRFFAKQKTIADAQAYFCEIPSTMLIPFLEKLVVNFLLDVANGPSFVKHAIYDLKDLTAWIHVTNRCNLRCTYCYLHKTDEDLSVKKGLHAIEAIFENAKEHNFTRIKLKYAGGESTLNFPLIQVLQWHATKLSKELNIDLQGVVLSNGIIVNERFVDFLLKEQVGLMISLDSLAPSNNHQRPFINGKGTYEIIQGNIEKLLKMGVRPFISITVTSQSSEDLPEILDYVIDKSLRFGLNFYRFNDLGSNYHSQYINEEKFIQNLLNAIETVKTKIPEYSLLGTFADLANLSVPHQRTCGVGQNYIVIDQNGNFAKCHMDISSTLGSISSNMISDIRKDQLGIQNLSVNEKEGCKSCKWKLWCTGGCPLLTYKTTGRYDVNSPYCNVYKAIFPELIKLEGLRLLNQSIHNK